MTDKASGLKRPGGVPEWDTCFEEVSWAFQALLSVHWVILMGCPLDRGFHIHMLMGLGLKEIVGGGGLLEIVSLGAQPLPLLALGRRLQLT